MKVIIIGSNLAGLCAACELLEQGCPVTIVETSPRLGGCASMAANATEDKANVHDVDWLCNLAGFEYDLWAERSPSQVIPAVIHKLEHFAAARPEQLSIWAGTTEIWMLASDPRVKCQCSGTIQQEMGFVILADGGVRIPTHARVMVCGASHSWLQAISVGRAAGREAGMAVGYPARVADVDAATADKPGRPSSTAAAMQVCKWVDEASVVFELPASALVGF